MGEALALVLGLVALWLAWLVLCWVCRGAFYLFVYAGQSGFIGHVVYFALWIVVFPIMAAVCLVVGLCSPKLSS